MENKKITDWHDFLEALPRDCTVERWDYSDGPGEDYWLNVRGSRQRIAYWRGTQASGYGVLCNRANGYSGSS